MTAYDEMIRVENYLESKFDAFADDYISEGYAIDKHSPVYHTAMVEFVSDAMKNIAATMVDNPKGDWDTTEGYVTDMAEEFADTEMDGMIQDKLEEYFTRTRKPSPVDRLMMMAEGLRKDGCMNYALSLESIIKDMTE